MVRKPSRSSRRALAERQRRKANNASLRRLLEVLIKYVIRLMSIAKKTEDKRLEMVLSIEGYLIDIDVDYNKRQFELPVFPQHSTYPERFGIFAKWAEEEDIWQYLEDNFDNVHYYAKRYYRAERYPPGSDEHVQDNLDRLISKMNDYLHSRLFKLSSKLGTKFEYKLHPEESVLDYVRTIARWCFNVPI